ncbi:Predicted G-protein coupled receptor [Ceraceosorus bombacis]|uniref:Predicted G-protein coupled receptor n=1 Tax=Ceraceosorus bombacis TaxID=401625 RepID=A0A0N7L8R6_9BASI|nr:Predicted G-protein coupled receptor [Ceraceosorus bombacis]
MGLRTGGGGLPSPVSSPSARRGGPSGAASGAFSAIAGPSTSVNNSFSSISDAACSNSDLANRLVQIFKRSLLPGTGIHGLTSLLFALSFEEATMLFALVLLEALDWLPRSTLVGNWKWSLIAILALSIVIVPLGICLLLTFRVEGSSSQTRRGLFAFLPFLGWILLFLRVPLPSALSGSSSAGLLDAALARTAVLGVSLIALLSGSAAASSAMDSWDAWFSKRRPRPPTAQDVKTAQDSFDRARSDLQTRKDTLESLNNRPASEERSSGFFDRLWGGSGRDREASSLRAEISGLEMLARAMRDDLDRITRLKREAEWSKTLWGRVLLGVGHIFSVYCVWRVGLALLSLLLLGYRDAAPPDFVSVGLAHLVRFLGPGASESIDLAMWTRQISLLFVGALIIVRMRSVLSGLGAFFRAASTGVSTGFLILFLAEVMTIYLLATLIQLRTALPPSFSGATSDQASQTQHLQHPPLLSTLPSFAIVFGALFDGGFLIAALVTGLYRWLTRDTEPTLFGAGGSAGAGGLPR